jgi:DNA-binding response OmpR family regulator
MPAVHRFRHTGRVRVLVIEDEAVLADALVTGLRREALAVDVAYDGAEGLDRALLNDYDVIVLDRDLPTVHGDDICRAVAKEQPATKVLMLTASAGVSSRVEGLSIGADDYLTKPFAFVELVARVRALGRRSRDSVPPILERNGIILDPARRVVERDKVPMALTRKEFGVLEELLRAAGAVVSSEHLLEKVWDENIDPFSNVLRTTVMTLRRKLGEPAVIETVPGIGYQL